MRMQSNWSPHTLLAGKQSGTALWKTVWQSLIKFNTLLQYTPAISFLYLLKTNEKLYSHKNCVSLNTWRGFIRNCPKLETVQVSFN